MDKKNDMNSSLKLSIVVPMYNSFATLKRNLSRYDRFGSLEVEVILVDDCSSDDSYSEACLYSQNASFELKVIRNEKNGGPGVSRNNGIREATGDYITFVDSDDYLSDDFEDKVVNLMKQNVDCIIFNYLFVSSEGKIIGEGKSTDISFVEGFIPHSDAFVYTLGSTCGKIYRKKIIDDNHIKFADLFRNEDMPFTKMAICCSDTIYYLDEPLYMYVQHKSSLMHNKKLNDEQNCQKAYALLSKGLDNNVFKEELKAVELREVLNNSVILMIVNDVSKNEIRKYIKKHYRLSIFKNVYYQKYPAKVKIITLLIFCRMFILLKCILKLKNRMANNKITKGTD